MKKFIVSFSLAALLLTGCGGVDRSMYPMSSEAEGEMVAVAYKPGNLYTHVIMSKDENGQTVSVAAKSATISLNKYNDMDVKASGMLDLAQDDKTEILEVDDIKIMINANMEMKEFDEIGRGFVVKYPEVLEVMPSRNVIDFSLINEPIYRIEVLPASTTNLETAVASVRGELAEDMYSEKNIEINDVPAIFERQKTDNDVEMRTVYVLGADNLYVIRYLGSDEDNAGIWKKMFDKIYDSFTAEDLDADILTKSCSALMSSIPCGEEQVCLLEKDGINGACVATEMAQKDIKIISDTCNNTQGFVLRSEFDCEAGDETCLFVALPECNCGAGRIWDELQGCIAGAQVAPEKPVADPIVPKPITPVEPTEQAAVPEDSREMVSEPWDYKLFYPKNWYYTGLGGGTYLFSESSKPEKKPAVVVRVVEKCNPDFICVNSGTQTFEIESYAKSYDADAQNIANTIKSSK